MQYTLNINQPAAIALGMNMSECAVMCLLVTMPAWAARETVDGKDFHLMTDSKLVQELPLVSGSAATFRRLIDQLVKKGLVEKILVNRMRYLRCTEKAMTWVFGTAQNCAPSPDTAQKCTPEVRKNAHSDRSKMRTYQYTNNQYTNNQIDNCAVPASNDLGVSDAIPEKTNKSPPRKTRLPDDFLLTPERAGKAYAHWQAKSRNDLSALDEFASFQNHHLQHGKTMACWESAWRTWYTNAVKFNRPPGQQGFLSANEKLAKAAESITDYEKSLDF